MNRNSEQYTRRTMRFIHVTPMLVVPMLILAQDVRQAVLSSHDKIDGRRGNENHISDLEIFDHGKVSYTEEGTKAMGSKAERMSYETTLTADELRRLEELLENCEIRTLAKKKSMKAYPIDFFWQSRGKLNARIP
jgi:hypothetical protein